MAAKYVYNKYWKLPLFSQIYCSWQIFLKITHRYLRDIKDNKKRHWLQVSATKLLGN